MTLQFEIPLVVARALPIWTVSAHARAAGIAAWKIAYEETTTRPRQMRIRCERVMAEFILRELQGLDHRAVDGDEFDLRAATTWAIAATQQAIAASHAGDNARGSAEAR